MAIHYNTPVLVNTASNYLVTASDEIIHIDTSSVAVSVEMPSTALADISTGFAITIVDVGGNLSSINAAVKGGGPTINGLSDLALTRDFMAVRIELFSDGKWRAIELDGGAVVTASTIDLNNNSDGTYTVRNGNPTPFTIDTRAVTNPYSNTTSGLAATNVQAAIDELQSSIGSSGAFSGFFLSDGVNPAASISSGETINFSDSGLIDFTVAAAGNSISANINVLGVTVGHVLTATSSGAEFQAPSASGLSTLTIQGDDATPLTISDTNSITIATGSTILSTIGSSGVSGPIITMNINAGADGQVLTSNAGVASWTTPAAGGFTNIGLAASSGTPQTVTDTQTISILKGVGIETTAGATNAVTIDLDASLVELNDVPAYPVVAGDYLLSYNVGTGTNTWIDQSTTAYTVDNGLTASTSTNFQWGGSLLADTQINTMDFEVEFIVAAEVPGGADNNGKIIFGNAASDYMLHIERTAASVEDKTLLYVDGKEPAAGYPTMKLDATVDTKTINEPILEIRHTGTVGSTPTGYLMTAYGDLDGGTTQDLVFSIRADGQMEAADEVILTGLQDHANDTAAGVAGLITGQVYFTTATTAVGDIAVGDRILKIKA